MFFFIVEARTIGNNTYQCIQNGFVSAGNMHFFNSKHSIKPKKVFGFIAISSDAWLFLLTLPPVYSNALEIILRSESVSSFSNYFVLTVFPKNPRPRLNIKIQEV